MTQDELNEALLAASRRIRPNEAVRLVELGAKPDVADVYGRQPLHLAASSDWGKLVKLLIAKGVRVDVMDKEGNQALHFAAANGYPDMVELLVDMGAKVEAANNDGFRPLHCAVVNGRRDVVKQLLGYGVDPMVLNNKGEIPGDFCNDAGIRALLDAAEREWKDSGRALAALLARQRKLGALRQKGPAL